jgi:hypothetical protein
MIENTVHPLHQRTDAFPRTRRTRKAHVHPTSYQCAVV